MAATRSRRRAFLAAALACLAAAALLPGRAAAGESSRGGTFMPLGWDARGESLGGAATLLSRDGAAAYWNPANLVFVGRACFSAGVYRPVEGLTNLYSTGTIAAGLMDTRTSPDGMVEIKRLGVALTVSHLGLELAHGSAWNEGTVGLAAGFSFNHWNSIGGAVRFLRSWTDVEDASSWGIAWDLGYATRLRRNVWAGVMMRNLGSSVHYQESDEEIESSISLALSVERILGRLSIEGDAVYRRGEWDRLLCGAELAVVDGIFYLQGGVDYRLVNHSRYIKHFGVMFRLLRTDIAASFGFDPEDAFGRQTRVTISHSL